MRPRWFGISLGLLKTASIVVGLLVTVPSLMSLVGLATGNGWARSIGAVLIALTIPAVVSDRLKPRDDFLGAPGLASDVFAVWLVGFGLAFMASGKVTRPLLLREADREAIAGAGAIARIAYFLAGARPEITPQVGDGAPKPSSGSGASDASATDAGLRAAVDGGDGGKVLVKPELTPAELFRELAPAVVNITVKESGGEGGGTGFFLDTDGTIATNHHVINGAVEIRIKLLSGKTIENGDVELLADNPADDLALLRLHTKETLKAVEFGDSEQVMVGEHVISIGNPLGLEHTLTDGLVSARRIYEGRAYIQMSAPVSPGNSGGPLFNMRGQVIGVTTAQVAGGLFGRAQNLNLAIPINVLKPMIQGDYPKRHRFGDAVGTSTW
jgi:serine protease Do